MTGIDIDQLKARIRLVIIVIVGTVTLIATWGLVSERMQAIATAKRQTEGYARALAEHSESAFAEADRVLLDILHDLRSYGGQERIPRRELFAMLRRQAEGAPQIGTMFAVDATGTMFINASEYPSRQIYVGDRDYFRNYQNNPGADLTLGRPVMSRLVNRWRFNLMRPLAAPGGPFAGLLAVAFEVDYYKRFFGPVSLGPNGRIMLVRADGRPLVCEPYADKAYDLDFSRSPLFRDKLPAAPKGTYRVDAGLVDDSPRIVSYQRLNRFPVVAIVSMHLHDVLGPWKRKAMTQACLTVVLCLLIATLARFLFRHLDHLRDAHGMLSKQQSELLTKAAQIDAANDAILLIDLDGRLHSFNQALCKLTGYAETELRGRRLQEIKPPVFAEQVTTNIRLLEQVGEAIFESAYLTKDGTVVPVEVRARTMTSEGRPMILTVVRDITQRQRDEMRKRTRSKILEEMATGTPLDSLLTHIVHLVEQELPGSLCSIMLADGTGHLRHGAAPGLSEAYIRAVDGLLIANKMGSCGTAAFLRSRVAVEDIETHPYWKGFKPARDEGLRACWSEPVLSADGDLLGTLAIYYREPRQQKAEEIQVAESAAHLAGIAIGRVNEEKQRKVLEEQLLHVQKIEAIGQLAGGIAHDFNNLLTPIIGYAEMLKQGVSDDHSYLRKVEGILSAALKAGDLTRRLLSFGRKQLLRVESFDLNQVIVAFREILSRTIRENIAIDLRLSGSTARIRADRGQIEQILLNLAVNAQDAISGNGSITIESGHVILDEEYTRIHPGMKTGPYILLAISDNGSGMEDEVLSHIFEPFFTTKPVGQGTGLGLATVYGIVKQHEGSVKVRSRVGTGSTFTILLPEAPATDDGELPAHIPSTADFSGLTGKTILVIDDNQLVREMVVELLRSTGNNILVATSPTEALELTTDVTTIDLLVTDVVMPDMNGPELYDRLQEKFPNMPVLFISGYTNSFVLHHGTLEEELSFLQKPFTAEQLLDRVHQILQAESATS